MDFIFIEALRVKSGLPGLSLVRTCYDAQGNVVKKGSALGEEAKAFFGLSTAIYRRSTVKPGLRFRSGTTKVIPH